MPRSGRVGLILMTLLLWACEQTVRVELALGTVEGIRKDGVDAFLGIPYAAPPVGATRFAPPRPIEPWSGVRETKEWPPACVQPNFLQVLLSRDFGITGQEDCLYLNVWVPSERDPEGHPIMVFVHGGGNEYGSGRGFAEFEIYDGARLARRGDVVVVTFNYRLGSFGYFAHPALNGGRPINVGLLDQIAALEWVREHAKSFGGDPARVTVFGESAGGNAVYHLLASPRAANLFQRAVLQSAPLDTYTAKAQIEVGVELAESLGCRGDGEDVATCLREVSASDIGKKQPNVARQVIEALESEGKSPPGARSPAMSFAPGIDGEVVVDEPLKVIERGAHNKVPIILGTNRRELDGIMREAVREPGDFERIVTKAVGLETTARTIRSLYPDAAYEDEGWAYGALMADLIFHCRAKQLARLLSSKQKEPVYAYVFDDMPARFDFVAKKVGVFHGLELFYLFDRMARLPWLYADESLAVQERLMTYWVHFAREANPNYMAAPLWMPFDTQSDAYMQISRESGMIRKFRYRECDVLRKEVPEFFGDPYARRS